MRPEIARMRVRLERPIVPPAVEVPLAEEPTWLYAIVERDGQIAVERFHMQYIFLMLESERVLGKRFLGWFRPGIKL